MYFQTMPHRTVRNLIALLFICLHSLPSSAQDESFKAVEKTPVTIHSLASGGYWSVGKDEGFFRAVITADGVEHVVHRLYIQWLKNDANTQGYELVRTVNVKELNLGHGYVMRVKTSFGDINSFKIDVTANSRSGEEKHYAITAKGDGKFIIH